MATDNDTRPETLRQHDACNELADQIVAALDGVRPRAMPGTPHNTAALREARSHLGAALAALRSLLTA